MNKEEMEAYDTACGIAQGAPVAVSEIGEFDENGDVPTDPKVQAAFDAALDRAADYVIVQMDYLGLPDFDSVSGRSLLDEVRKSLAETFWDFK